MRKLACAAVLAWVGCTGAWAMPSGKAEADWAIVIHGGAGVIERGALDSATEAQIRAALEAALRRGSEILAGGGAALDAVEASIRILEDDPNFNAGRGAVFTAEGKHELDASIMDGQNRTAGAVAGVTQLRHPISAARAVMEKSPHVMLAGAGAEAFAVQNGLETVDPSFFFTERRWAGLVKELTARGAPIPPRPVGATGATGVSGRDLERKFGTVGVAARDASGNLAAGTSTGGTTAKRWGRLGDSPVIGAGTYAQNGVCAVSATGTGEYFIRAAVAKSICARIELKHERPARAADAIVQKDLPALGGDGGVIVMGARGEGIWSFNTPGMYRARASAKSGPEIAIYQDER